jgi:hypothetical protein
MSIFDNRDGGNKELPAGNYTAQAQYRQNLTLYYVYAADDKFVPHDHPVLHCGLRVEDDSSVTAAAGRHALHPHLLNPQSLPPRRPWSTRSARDLGQPIGLDAILADISLV